MSTQIIMMSLDEEWKNEAIQCSWHELRVKQGYRQFNSEMMIVDPQMRVYSRQGHYFKENRSTNLTHPVKGVIQAFSFNSRYYASLCHDLKVEIRFTETGQLVSTFPFSGFYHLWFDKDRDDIVYELTLEDFIRREYMTGLKVTTRNPYPCRTVYGTGTFCSQEHKFVDAFINTPVTTTKPLVAAFVLYKPEKFTMPQPNLFKTIDIDNSRRIFLFEEEEAIEQSSFFELTMTAAGLAVDYHCNMTKKKIKRQSCKSFDGEVNATYDQTEISVGNTKYPYSNCLGKIVNFWFNASNNHILYVMFENGEFWGIDWYMNVLLKKKAVAATTHYYYGTCNDITTGTPLFADDSDVMSPAGGNSCLFLVYK